MSNLSSTIVQKLWNYCNVLQDDGVSYSDYVEELTYLLFLKMVDEQAQLPPPLGKPSTIPKAYDWQTLRLKDEKSLNWFSCLESMYFFGTPCNIPIFRYKLLLE